MLTPIEIVDAAWEAEIARRIQQIDSGEVECVPWETVLAELRTRFGSCGRSFALPDGSADHRRTLHFAAS